LLKASIGSEIDLHGGNSMDGTTTILLRLIHILAGIFWVGAVFFVAGFLVPTVRETGREGGRFMQHLAQRRRLPVFLGIAASLTVLSGLFMYGRLVSSTHGQWARSGPGIGYGIGGLAALLGGIAGGAISGRAARRMAAIGQAAGAAGPSAEQQAEMGRLQSRIAVGSRITAGLLAVAAGAMAVARYL
jgi:uncharacterized membrane protein